MKNILLLTVFLSVCLVSSAQISGDGYYRVSNDKTGRYIYVCDNTGSINYQSTSADVGAIKLLTDHSQTISNPASVIYIKTISGSKYDLQSQGTGIHDIIQYYVTLTKAGTHYVLYAEGQYLSDCEISTDTQGNPIEEGYLGIKNVGASYRMWNVTPVSAQTDEFFGITPSVTVGSRHFQPFYADFGFSLASEGMKVWFVSQITEYGVVISEIPDAVIPANTPVFIECSSTDPKDNRLELVSDHSPVRKDNILKGVYFNIQSRPKSKDARTAYDKNTMRVLGLKSDGTLGYVPFVGEVNKYTKLSYLDANKSYLPVAKGTPDELSILTESEYAALLKQKQREKEIADSIRISDSIKVSVAIPEQERILDVFDINGRRTGGCSREEISKLPAGIYIIDKRKVIIR